MVQSMFFPPINVGFLVYFSKLWTEHCESISHLLDPFGEHHGALPEMEMENDDREIHKPSWIFP